MEDQPNRAVVWMAGTAAEGLREHVTLRVEAIDRMDPNLYVPILQNGRGIASAHPVRACGGRDGADPRLRILSLQIRRAAMRNPTRWSVALLALLLTPAFGCAIGPVWARRLEGRVIHAETGEPVEGALVLQQYQVMGGDLTYTFDDQWTTTDAQGRFAIPGHIALTAGPPFTYTEDFPLIEVVHRGLKTSHFFSWDSDPEHPLRVFPGWRQLELAIKPGRSAHVFEKTWLWGSLCSGYSSEACAQLCKLAYGSAEACYKQGRPRR